MARLSADDMVTRLAAGDPDMAFGLLDEIGKGYPPERVVALALSDEPAAVEAAAWIMSELGPAAAPYRLELERLLWSPLPRARFWALDPILATECIDGQFLRRAVDLIHDEDRAVRWAALTFLARCSSEQLRV